MIGQYSGGGGQASTVDSGAGIGGRKLLFMFGVLVAVTLLIAVLFYVLGGEPQAPVCGDSVCGRDENCFDCGDCRCTVGKYCSPTEKVCLRPVCGNSRCESLESPSSCCIDCFCSNPGEECNAETKKCEPIKLLLTEERAKELIESYYRLQGETVVSMNVRGPWRWDDVPILLVEVTVEDQGWPLKVGVYEDEKVIELPAL